MNGLQICASVCFLRQGLKWLKLASNALCSRGMTLNPRFSGELRDKHVPLCFIYSVLGIELKALCMLSKHFTNLVTSLGVKICVLTPLPSELEVSNLLNGSLAQSCLTQISFNLFRPYLGVTCFSSTNTTFIHNYLFPPASSPCRTLPTWLPLSPIPRFPACLVPSHLTGSGPPSWKIPPHVIALLRPANVSTPC